MSRATTGPVGAYPGSFNPLTVAHLAIAEAAHRSHRLHRLDLVVSRVALAKEDHRMPPIDQRIEVLERAAAGRSWLAVVVTDHQLVADLAQGYDVVVMGADKWAQVHDPGFYGGSTEARDRALARLPTLAIAPRPPHEVPAEHRLDVDDHYGDVSASAVRAGRIEWLAPEARDRSGGGGGGSRSG